MAIIEKNRYRLFKPRGRYHQIRRVIAVHIARGDMQSPGRRNNQNRLKPRRTELQLNPIIGSQNVTRAGFYSHQVGPQIPIEIGDSKRRVNSRLT